MEHDDDPEKRIAELERLQAQAGADHAVEPTTPYPPAPQLLGWQQPVRQSGYGPPLTYSTGPLPSGRPRRRGRFRAVFGTIFFGVVALGMAGFAGHALYGYAVGTPTTAHVLSCYSSGKSRHCTGTWAIDGATQTGKIDGATKGYHTGLTVDVRVHDGTAYTTGSISRWLWPAVIFVGFGVLSAFLQYRKRRRFR